MPVRRYNEKRLPERQFEYRKERLELESYMHDEPIYYGNSAVSSGSITMPAVWNTTYTNSYVNGGTIQWNPLPPATPPARVLTPMEWLDEQVNAVCRRSGL